MVDPELAAIGAEAPARLTDLGVMPEPGGEGEEPQPDAGAQARECAGAVALEAELSPAGPKDRFDPPAHAPERSELERLVLAIGTKELGSAIGHPALELGAGEALAAGSAGSATSKSSFAVLVAPTTTAASNGLTLQTEMTGSFNVATKTASGNGTYSLTAGSTVLETGVHARPAARRVPVLRLRRGDHGTRTNSSAARLLRRPPSGGILKPVAARSRAEG
jgi:hypothetical protein